MARPSRPDDMVGRVRLEFEGAFYHITSRGNLRDRIFFDDKDRERFLEILRRTKERYTSYREYIGAYKEKEPIVDTAETLSCFSRTKTAAMKAYGEFVKEGIGERNNPIDVEAGVLLGSKIFIAKIRDMLQKRKPDEDIPQS